VRKFSICLAAAAVMVAGALHVAWGQGAGGGAAAPRPTVAHKVGLIDMAALFNKYKKFEKLREELRAEIEERQEELNQNMQQLRQLADEMKTFGPDTKEYSQREKRATQLQIELQSSKAAAQRKFFQEESRMYRTIYLEVTDLVKKYAEYHKYTLILRFTSDDLGENDDPQKVMAALQRQVVYYRSDDDITNEVLKFLNSKYETSAEGTAGREPIQRTGGTTKPRKAASTEKTRN